MNHAPPPMPSQRPQPPKPKRTKGIIIGAATIAAASIGGIAFWLAQPSYDDIVKDCMRAVEERADGDKSKPAACDELKEKDYDAVILNHVIDDLGWTDDEGNFDKNKMIEDGLSDSQP